MTIKKVLILIIALVIILMVFSLVYYYIKMAPFRHLSSDSVVLSEPPKDDSWKEIKYFDALPEGFPENIPVDSNPLEVLKSYFAISYNPPPKDAQYSVYSYLTRDDAKEAFEKLKNYAVQNGLSIAEEEKDGHYAFYAKDKTSYYNMNVSITSSPESGGGINIVTISILIRPSQKPDLNNE